MCLNFPSTNSPSILMSNLFPFTDTDPFGFLMVTTLLNNFVLAVLEELK